ncbi:hypothetical protein [Gorillibacterium massiliense]|uniref:hypothetical protein n=1 Tax=Gorillibacterium massiliense TaxID=1280390 RepID=UPI0004B8F75D|nr:hypothetical protein [Gorillibacterium massiliense]
MSGNGMSEDRKFLDEVYAKARLLAFDKKEEEKVRQNRAKLAKRRRLKIAAGTVLAVGGYLFLYDSAYSLSACFILSFALAVVGIVADRVEMRLVSEEWRK